MGTLSLDDRGLLLPCASCGATNRVRLETLDRATRCGTCKADLSPTARPLEVSSTADFDRLIAGSRIPTVVDYWAPWCGPCRMVAPELEKVAARSNGRYLIVKVNTDALSDLGARFSIRSIPTLAVYAAGRELKRITGARPAADIEAFILS